MSESEGIRRRLLPLGVLASSGALAGIVFHQAGIQGMLIVALAACSLAPLLLSWTRTSVDVFEPIVFYSLFMAMTTIAIVDRVYLRPSSLRYPELVPWHFSTAFALVSAIYLLFFVLVLVGYYTTVERWIEVPSFAPNRDRHSVALFRYGGAIYAAVGVVFYVLLVGSALEWELLRLYTTTEPRSQLFVGSYHLVLGSRMVYVGYFLWLTSVLLRGDRPGVFHALAVLPPFVLFLLLGGRQRAITILLILVIVYSYVHIRPTIPTTPGRIRVKSDELHRKVKSISLPLVGGIVGTIIVFARIVRSWRDLDGASTTGLLVELATFGIHNEHLDYLLVTLHVVPEELGYYWGTLPFRVPMNYIPRSLWDEKPVLTVGSELRRAILPGQAGGRDPGLLGQFYADAGFVGICFGALLFGIVLRVVYVCFERNSHSPIMLVLYAFVVASIVPGGISNNALVDVSDHLLLFTPILILDWYLRNADGKYLVSS